MVRYTRRARQDIDPVPHPRLFVTHGFYPTRIIMRTLRISPCNHLARMSLHKQQRIYGTTFTFFVAF